MPIANGFSKAVIIFTRLLNNEFMRELIKFSFSLTPEAQDENLINHSWKAEIHQVRVIASSDEKGEPTPEGIHRDGGESGFVFLLNRENAKSAQSSVYDNDCNVLTRFTLTNTMDTMGFLDPHVLHSVTPMLPQNSN